MVEVQTQETVFKWGVKKSRSGRLYDCALWGLLFVCFKAPKSVPQITHIQNLYQNY